MNRFVAAAAALAACQAPNHASPPPVRQLDAVKLAGDWRWILRTDEAGTSRIETEDWHLAPSPSAPLQLVGRYVRTVEVRSLDRVPFRCNERPWYRQRAVYDVSVALGSGANRFDIAETGYATEPSPCDHGFRHVGAYSATLTGDRLALAWDGGTQTLWKTSSEQRPLPPQPWPAQFELAGPWRWDATSYDADGNLRDESEWWELTRRSNTSVETSGSAGSRSTAAGGAEVIDATYRRRVTTRSPDGSPIACAGAPSWAFDDVYVLQGEREEAHWHFHELAVEPGDHPCLRATPKRILDEATAEQIGNFLVLEWRGKRRQVLYRDQEGRGE
jgi:hypothetical protein